MDIKKPIHARICEIMTQVDAISKSKANTQQGYKFRGIDDVYNDIHPLFAAAGVFSTSKVVSEKSEERTTKNGGALIYRILHVAYTFFGAEGDSVTTEVIGEGMDSGDKASNKAMAVAHKYAIMQLLSIPTEDSKDPETESPAPMPKAAPAQAAKPTPTAQKPPTNQSKPDTQPKPQGAGADAIKAMCAASDGAITFDQAKQWLKETFDCSGMTLGDAIGHHFNELKLHIETVTQKVSSDDLPF